MTFYPLNIHLHCQPFNRVYCGIWTVSAVITKQNIWLSYIFNFINYWCSGFISVCCLVSGLINHPAGPVLLWITTVWVIPSSFLVHSSAQRTHSHHQPHLNSDHAKAPSKTLRTWVWSVESLCCHQCNSKQDYSEASPIESNGSYCLINVLSIAAYIAFLESSNIKILI